jgi:hypothetical protein
MLKVLVACEESQAVTKAFRELGHEAYSCDILPQSGGHPEWHLQGDVFNHIKEGWDIMVAHPPCTYLAVSGASHMYNKDGSINMDRKRNQDLALKFVQDLLDAPIDHIALENPVSVISTKIRKPDQIIQPWMFGHKFSKATCLWLKNLPKLNSTEIVDKGEFKEWIDKKTGKKKRQPMWFYDVFCKAKTAAERRTLRSKTFPNIAKAMAEQWSNAVIEYKNSQKDSHLL